MTLLGIPPATGYCSGGRTDCRLVASRGHRVAVWRGRIRRIADQRDGESATEIADRIIDRHPGAVHASRVSRSSSTPVSASPSDHRASPHELLRNADVAMYRAKRRGEGRREVFEPAMHAELIERMQLESDLRQAVIQCSLTVCYQPIVSLATGAIKGFEALARWTRPGRGPVPPADFIPLSEETGLILPIGHWILNEACHQVCQWQRDMPGLPPLTMNVNLSARQLRQADLVDEVRQALAYSGLPPAQLVLEITESLLHQDVDEAAERLLALKALGLRLAIDDFGTGYSSLSCLHRFPIDIMKIDKSFVHGLVGGTNRRPSRGPSSASDRCCTWRLSGRASRTVPNWTAPRCPLHLRPGLLLRTAPRRHSSRRLFAGYRLPGRGSTGVRRPRPLIAIDRHLLYQHTKLVERALSRILCPERIPHDPRPPSPQTPRDHPHPDPHRRDSHRRDRDRHRCHLVRPGFSPHHSLRMDPRLERRLLRGGRNPAVRGQLALRHRHELPRRRRELGHRRDRDHDQQHRQRLPRRLPATWRSSRSATQLANGRPVGSRPSAPTSRPRPAARSRSRAASSSRTSAVPRLPATGRRSGRSATPHARWARPTGRASASGTSWRTSTA